MKVVLFCHSILSDWNNGNAHFLRGIVAELLSRGCSVSVFEPSDGWSAQNLTAEAGPGALDGVRAVYPNLDVHRYDLQTLDVDAAVDSSSLVIVHEWSALELIARLGQKRARGGRYRLLFHDTHHRMVSAPDEMRAYDFGGYDGVLAFGEVLRQRYEDLGWGKRAYVWHEAADTRIFYPRPKRNALGDLVWIGNWGDEERSAELHEFLLGPARALALRARVYGVRYPDAAVSALSGAGIEYGGWLPNYSVPEVFAGFRVTVHVPRRPYAETLRGIPTIRPFEALACGIPLVSAPWHDTEGLLRRGSDYLVAHSGAEMAKLLRDVLSDASLAEALARSGRETILARHTCAHRVDELLHICRELGLELSSSGLSPRTARAAAGEHARSPQALGGNP